MLCSLPAAAGAMSKVILESGKTKTAKNSRLCVAFRMFFQNYCIVDPLVKKLEMNMLKTETSTVLGRIFVDVQVYVHFAF